jgi:hypothetical protein
MAAAAAVILCAGVATGCYVYEPVTASMIAPGKSIAIDLNDLGRLNLATLIGPEVKRVSGVLVSQSANEYVMRVNQLTFFNQKESQWSGEAITIRNDYVGTLYQEKLSPSRTALAVGGAAAGVGALLAARNLIVNGNSNDETKNPPPPPATTSRGNE